MERNERIQELVAHGTKHLKIAFILDDEGYPPPPDWRVEGFKEAYNNPYLRSLFHKMCSAQRPIKNSPPFSRK